MPSKPAAESQRPGQEPEALHAAVARLERELEIEAALERVRARAMAMRTSSEMLEVADVLFRELRGLGDGLEANLWGCGFVICKPDCDDDEVWFANQFGILPAIVMPHTEDPTHKKMYEGWQSKSDLYSEFKEGAELKAHYDYMLSVPDVRPIFEEILASGLSFPTWQKWHAAYFSHGYLLIITTVPYENEQIFTRFARVFEQTYTRFLDLLKAEAQAREAEIQLALERVRARTMAMHHSDEFPEMANNLYLQVQTLGIRAWSAGYCLWEDDARSYICCMSSEGVLQIPMKLPSIGVGYDFYTPYREGKEFHVDEIHGEEVKAHYDFLLSLPDFRENAENIAEAGFPLPQHQVFHIVFFSHGFLMFITYEPVEDQWEVFKRFGQVFQQSYTRFLDLQKAEAQAREAQIEAALERVRAASMAMHTSNELLEVGELVYKELSQLGIASMTSGITIMDQEGKIDWYYMVNPNDGSIMKEPMGIPRDETKTMRSLTRGWELMKPCHIIALNERETVKHQTYIAENSVNFDLSAEELISLTPKKLNLQSFNFKQGFLLLVGAERLSGDQIDTTIRFTKAFEQAYTRFLDLQKAEAQAREAQIEAALERVRAASMAMHRSDELSEVAAVLYKELRDLGISDFVTCGFTIYDEVNWVQHAWITQRDGGLLERFTLPLDGDIVFKERYQAWKKRKPMFQQEISGQTRRDHLGLAIETSESDSANEMAAQFPDPLLFYNANFAQGYLSVISGTPLSPEKQELLVKFARVFEQTYTRFLDIQKAEQHAREAQIETALERVRAASMAMHDSSELQTVVNTLFEQLKALRIPLNSASIFILEEGKKDWQQWVATDSTSYSTFFHLPYGQFRVQRDFQQAREKGLDFYTALYTRRQKNSWFEHAFAHTEYRRVPKARQRYMLETDRLIFSVAIQKHIALQLAKYEGDPFSEDENKTLKRFSKVFEQAYTRFLDLQKAEAQAREAQIEAALERVRAASMAMHQSEELNEVLKTMFQELLHLDFKLARCVIWIYNEEDRTVRWYAANPEAEIESYLLPYSDYKSMKDYWEFWEKRIPRLYYDLSGDLKKGMDEYIFNHTEMSRMPEAVKEGMMAPEQVHLYNTFQDFGALFVSSEERLGEEVLDILERFGRAFNQSYTRFLDLQRAEAQAREAEVQLALERVRAATMAMHSSSELSEVAAVLFRQMHDLGVTPERVNIGIVQEQEGLIEYWSTEQGGRQIDRLFKGSIEEPTTLSKLYAGWKAGEEILELHQTGKELAQWIRHLTEVLGIPFDEQFRQERRVQTAAYFKHGMLLISTPDPVSEESLDLLSRFGKVFEQTYTRFLDLQKAEAQAREAEIQLALERVRARTMAMHKSSELAEVAALLFRQLELLGAKLWSAGFAICRDGETLIEKWMSSPITGQLFDSLRIPYNADHGEQSMYDTWKNQVELYSYVQDGKELSDIYEQLMQIPSFRDNFGKVVESGRPLPKWQKNHVASYKNGYLLIITEEEFEEEHIFPRFAKVFDQTYTRFLDLQKAEAQAREAQIEAALERVRARAMAMHSSNELIEVANVMHEQMTLLQQSQLEAFVIHLYPEKGDQFEAWISQKTPGKENRGLTTTLTLSKKETKFAQQFFKLYLSEPKEYLIHAHGEVLGEWNRMVISRIKGLKKAWGKNIPTSQYWFFCDFSGGSFLLVSRDEPNEESKELTRRASSVFDLAYRRFLDLQRAEAQAREAQIEAALERVRAKSLAMHNSTEMAEVVAVLFDELVNLDLVLSRCIIWIIDPIGFSSTLWMANSEEDKKNAKSYHIPRIEHPYYDAIIKGWKKKMDRWVYELKGNQKKAIDKFLLTKTELANLPEPVKKGIRGAEQTFVSGAFNRFGLIEASGPVLHTDQQQELLSRFSKVFEQSYQRFVDLQKAEAQAREAEIQLALERIRARSMAMQSSEDLREVVQVMYEQVEKLGIAKWGCMLLLFDQPNQKIQGWFSDVIHSQYPRPFEFTDHDHEILKKWWVFWESNDENLSIHLKDDEKHDFSRYLFSQTGMKDLPEDFREFVMREPEVWFEYTNMDCGLIEFIDHEPFPEASIPVLNRISQAFEQAYTRFLDLEKAEAQAREAQIEAALERVRAKTMAMHNTEDIGATVATFFRELVGLGLDTSVRVGIGILSQSARGELWTASEKDSPEDTVQRGYLDMSGHPLLQNTQDTWARGEPNCSKTLKGEAVRAYYRHINEAPDYPVRLDPEKAPEVLYHNGFHFRDGSLFAFTPSPLPDDIRNILERFAVVFGQTYTRYLDLQRAEERAREARIEAALERVRAKTMAMHNTEDIGATVITFFEELVGLGLGDSMRIGIGILSQSEQMKFWTATINETSQTILQTGFLDMSKHPLLVGAKNAWAQGVSHYNHRLEGEDVKIYFQTLNDAPEVPAEFDLNKLPPTIHHQSYVFGDGILYSFTDAAIPEDISNIMERFAAVFGQTYTRYLDLQRAEERAREAQIEAALERVRARTMAMHNTEDIADTVTTFFNELLGLNPDASLRCGVGILSQTEHMQLWTASGRNASQTVLHAGILDMSVHPLLKAAKANWASQGPPFTYALKGPDQKRYFQAMNEAPDYPARFDLDALPKVIYHNSFVFRDGILFAFTDTPLADDIRSILERFAAVFGQTYTRYLDLQKAEQRAREAEIESGLERVRARSMAMHKSDELLDLSVVLFQELDKLGVQGFFNCGFVEVDEASQKQSGWTTMTDGSLGEGYFLPLRGDAVLDARYLAWKQGEPVYCQKVSGRDLEAHMAFAMPTLGSERVQEMASTFPDPTYFYCFNFSQGYLSIISGETLDREAESILVRFTRAFEQAYIRFMDLQKAEAQAREAQIEAALERVRSRSMAMHHTGELQDVINTVYQQFLELKVAITGGAFIAINADIGSEMVCWGAGGTAEYIQEVHLPFMDMPIYTNLVAGIKKGRGFFVESFSREEKQQFFKALFKNLPYSEAPASRKKEILSRPGGYTRSCVVSQNTSIFIINHHGQPFSDEDNEILRRMGKVFEQTYTRFLDLQKAEAQAREASRQASIERVRGEIASMRSTADLERITPLIWNELTALGVPFIRCGVFIIQEQTQTIQTYLSAPDGHALGVMNLDFDAGETTRETVAHWRRNEAYQPQWTAEEFTAWTESLIRDGKIKDRKTYQDTERPPEMLYLNFIPFAQGMLYVGNTAPLEEEALELIQSLAEAFSFAYARYEDFNQLEKALSELKATQAQLIQSEKMASLGELTAGIAHEIKNPLNFVNNFSDVSRELLDELLEELEKGDLEEVKALANDVSDNLEKIVHHGMRADGIVKGMLQHSRSGDGKKEPTDLNGLADEYLRLAYHGLRAKDKSFNATLETDFDPGLGQVQLIPQDMGRVILNLLTNAFYAVSEKAREGQPGYVPTVSIKTAREDGRVVLSVSDNGNGIPEKVREKVFQPFFTTKPTGEGTGLGLSMSYDIVTKGHGGELRAETEEGTGTTFFITFKKDS